MKTKIFIAILIVVCNSIIGQQNVPEWFLPSSGGVSYMNFNSNPVSSYGLYDNYSSTSTLIKGANNTGLFALQNGVLLDEVNYAQSDPYDITDGSQRMVYYEVLNNHTAYRTVKVQGFTECIPLPIPLGNGKVDCNRYYVFSCGYGFSRNWKTDASGSGLNFNLLSYEPYYSIVNMNTNSHDQYFETLQMKTSNPQPNLRCTALPLMDMTGLTSDAALKSSATFIAATKLRSDNTYFLFVFQNSNLMRFIVSSTGITYANTVYTIPNCSVNDNIPSEMEVTELSNGDYRVAIPFIDYTNSNDVLKVCEVYGTGGSTGNLKTTPAPFDITLVKGSQPSARLHGIEFSPQNNYLYFTHETNTNNLNPIEYYDFTTGTRSAVACAPLNKANFTKSFIEKNTEINHDFLYFSSANEFVRLTNPDAPGSSGWVILQNTASGYVNSLGSIINFNETFYTSTSYMLPDYADKHDYMLGYQANQCCLEYKAVFNINEPVTMPTGTYNVTNGSVIACTGASGAVSVTFNSTTNINGNITIPVGTKVTFQNLVLKFTPNAALIVNSNPTAGQQGGKVALQTSTLTAYTGCDPNSMWPGIILNGYNNGVINQGTSTNSQNAVLTNVGASQIDHALTAIKINGGAIAIFTNSRLYDNKVAIEATSYTSPGGVLIDASLFQSVVIKTQSTFNIVQPSYLVNIVGRSPRMRFLSCTLANEATVYDNTYDGIIASNSTLWVSVSTLSRFRYGIYNTNTSAASSRLLTVGGSTFNNNGYGLYVGTTNLASIVGNHFNVLDNSTLIQWPLGLLLDASSKFTVNTNVFKNFSLLYSTISVGGNFGGTTGLCARNTNVTDANFVNIIEANIFSKLNTAVTNEGVNSTYNVSSTPCNDRGLRYYCNDFQDNLSWFSMLFNWSIIDYHQGVGNYGSQNLFNHTSGVNMYGVGQDPTTSIGYIHQDNGTTAYIPTIDASQGLLFYLYPITNNINDCSTTAVGGPGGRLANDKNPVVYLNSINEMENNLEQLGNSKGNNSSEIAYLAGKRDQLQKELLMYYLNDSMPSSSDSAKKYMERFITQSKNNRQILSFYLSNNNISAAKKAFSDLQTEGISTNASTVYASLIALADKDMKAELLADKDLFAKIDAIANDKSDIEAYLLSRWMINMIDANTYRETIIGIAPTNSGNSTGVNNLKQSIYKLSNYPNPFSNTTTITVSVPEETKEATIKVTDVLGREVNTYTLANGKNTIEFNNENTKGLLFYTLYVNGSQVETKIMMKNN